MDLFVPNVFFNLSKSEITNYQNERKSQRIPKYVVSLFSPRSTISLLLLENLVYDLCPEYVSLFFGKILIIVIEPTLMRSLFMSRR